ncbi:helix-turn-helix domain-containing protein [Amycolatopsis sp. NPDC047767]|uniref:winged helix-turn-helix transcriptional regulator n=1 Tax=Amycolatopsis sp. NPDC047767 TaxID=3156765 RepID=UPI0034555CB6
MAMTLEGAVTDRRGWRAENCSITKAIEVVGARATVLVLREAFYGTTRFDEFVDRTDLSPSVAAARLKQLVELGALEKQPYREPGARPRDEYVLTPRGRDLFPVVLALMQWADKHLQPDGGPVRIVERRSGKSVSVAPHTDSGEPLNLEDLAVVPNETWVRP